MNESPLMEIKETRKPKNCLYINKGASRLYAKKIKNSDKSKSRKRKWR